MLRNIKDFIGRLRSEVELVALVIQYIVAEKFWAVAGHHKPDMELLFMLWMADRKEGVRDRASIIEDFHVFYLPSGPLRRDDFEDVFKILEAQGNAKVNEILFRVYASEEWQMGFVPEWALRELGVAGFDNAGGTHDQHDKEDSQEKASVDRLAEETGFTGYHLYPVIDVISRNDRTGEATSIDDPDVDDSNTPNVQRNLRMLITGLNERYWDRPQYVFEVVATAFDAVDTAMLKIAEECAEDHDLMVEKVRELFLWSNLFKAVKAHFAPAEGDKDAVRRRKLYKIDNFKRESERAFALLQVLWEEAVRDYWNPTKTNWNPKAGQKCDQVVTADGRRLNVVLGASNSPLYGKVARYGNVPLGAKSGRKGQMAFTSEMLIKMGVKPEWLPEKGKLLRPKADVVVQHSKEQDGRGGKYIVSTRNQKDPETGDDINPIYLDVVTECLRIIDLENRGYLASAVYVLDEESNELVPADLQQPGLQRVLAWNKEKGDYEWTHVHYYAEFRKCVGNRFNTNPYAPKCYCSRQDINQAVKRGLRMSNCNGEAMGTVTERAEEQLSLAL
ncbi:hypothetical protein ACFL26_01565 [Patescibacteria group bacterium]